MQLGETKWSTLTHDSENLGVVGLVQALTSTAGTRKDSATSDSA